MEYIGPIPRRGVSVVTAFCGWLAAVAVAMSIGPDPAWSGEPEAAAAEDQVREESSFAVDYLFDRAHFGAITEPVVLRYRFVRASVAEDGFEDTIDIRVDRIGDGGRRDTSFEFFTGERRRPYPSLSDFVGNPLIAVFLQRDVWELSRLRGGQARYFRYRIREALRDKAEVTSETIQTPAGPVAAKRITITPYKDDRYRRRLDQFEFKTYEFVVSDGIPGEIYMIRTVVPGKKVDGKATPPLIEETVTFEQQLAYQNKPAEQ